MDISLPDLEVSATRLGLDQSGGTLVVSQDEIAFYPTFTTHAETHIATDSITNFALNTEDSRSERITLTRLFFLKWLAFAFPKATGSVATMITVQSDNEQVTFRIDDRGIDEVQQSLTPYLDTWGIVLN